MKLGNRKKPQDSTLLRYTTDYFPKPHIHSKTNLQLFDFCDNICADFSKDKMSTVDLFALSTITER